MMNILGLSAFYHDSAACLVQDGEIVAAAQEEGLFGIDKLNTVRSTIPVVTHVDYSARIQTVDEQTHGVYYRTIRRSSEKYGCGVIVNTSFNVRGEPLVCTPEEAYRCFMRTEVES